MNLENNGVDNLEVAGVSFTFPAKLEGGEDYAVTVAAPPEQQFCSVDNAAGTVLGSDVDDVEVLCRGWRGAKTIDYDNVRFHISEDSRIATDEDGNLFVVWREPDSVMNRYQDIFVSTYSPINGWSTPERLQTILTSPSSRPIMPLLFGSWILTIRIPTKSGRAFTMRARMPEKARS